MKRAILFLLLIAIGVAVIVAVSTTSTDTPEANPDQATQENNAETLTDSDNEIPGLPPDVLSGQIMQTYSINRDLYSLAFQNNSNFYIPALRGIQVQWHGVLRSQDNGQTWAKFFTVIDPADPDQKSATISYNPIGVFAENGVLFVDIVNTRGAGSGEGELLRFSTSDNGKTWKRLDCYYFIPENYNLTTDGTKTEIRPHGLDQIDGCIY